MCLADAIRSDTSGAKAGEHAAPPDITPRDRVDPGVTFDGNMSSQIDGLPIIAGVLGADDCNCSLPPALGARAYLAATLCQRLEVPDQKSPYRALARDLRMTTRRCAASTVVERAIRILDAISVTPGRPTNPLRYAGSWLGMS
jgi:hypothetical protein